MLTAGAANLPALAPTPKALELLLLIWNTGITRTMILPVALVAVAVPFTFAMEWLNAKMVALARKRRVDVREDRGRLEWRPYNRGNSHIYERYKVN
jgi:hypothetical protein